MKDNDLEGRGGFDGREHVFEETQGGVWLVIIRGATDGRCRKFECTKHLVL